MPKRPSSAQIVRVVRRPGTEYDGWLSVDGLRLPCQIGRAGITRLKREGDGATPAARMRLLGLRYRADRIARPPGPFGVTARAIAHDDGWCDDPADARYNRPVRLPYAASHEVMARPDGLYDIVGILDWNVTHRVAGRGSAIFLHQSRPDRGPTAGCIALNEHDLRLLLTKLRSQVIFVVA